MTGTDDEETPETKPRRTHFRRSDRPKLAPDAAGRQVRVTKLAFETLGKDGAIAYLNLASDKLGGRPLDLATASPAGLAQVELDLAAMRTGVGA
jgi:uncharacterized protein (DUF2384 family)